MDGPWPDPAFVYALQGSRPWGGVLAVAYVIRMYVYLLGTPVWGRYASPRYKAFKLHLREEASIGSPLHYHSGGRCAYMHVIYARAWGAPILWVRPFSGRPSGIRASAEYQYWL